MSSMSMLKSMSNLFGELNAQRAAAAIIAPRAETASRVHKHLKEADIYG